MTVSEVIRKRDDLNTWIQTLDNHVLVNFLQEYYDLLGSLPVGYTEVKWNEKL